MARVVCNTLKNKNIPQKPKVILYGLYLHLQLAGFRRCLPCEIAKCADL